MLAPEAKAKLEKLEADAANAMRVSIWDQWEPGLRRDASGPSVPASAPAPAPVPAPAAPATSELAPATEELLDSLF